MAANKKPRKHHRPHARLLIGGLSVIAKHLMHDNPLPPERQANVVIAYHTSIDAITGGYAEKTHFDSLVYALNIGSILAQHGIGNEYLSLFGPAKDALLRCKERWLATGKFGLDGEGLQAVRDAAPLHEAQLTIATQGELEAAIHAMHKTLADQDRMAA